MHCLEWKCPQFDEIVFRVLWMMINQYMWRLWLRAVMQQAGHYFNWCWPRSMMPYGIDRPQWCHDINVFFFCRSSNQDCSGILELVESAVLRASPNHQLRVVSLVPILWASCQIRKIAGAHAPGMPETFSPLPQVSDPDMHRGTCVTHVPWCMPGSLTSGFLWSRRVGKTFPAFPAHAQPIILRIWWEAHPISHWGFIMYNDLSGLGGLWGWVRGWLLWVEIMTCVVP